MPTSYEQARDALYRAPLDTFVQERKRLAAELARAGDKPGSKQLAKLPRPNVSAWAVNQLYWEAHENFEALFTAAKRVGEGDPSARGEHREAMAFLRARAAELLADAGHATTESTLRRVTATLSALAASGSFEPDAPGTLSADRDPPGFEAALFAAESPAPAASSAPRAPITMTKESAGARDEARRRADEAAKRDAAARRAAEERERKQAERKRIEVALITLKGRVSNVTREIERLRGEIARLEGELEQRAEEREKARAALQALEQNLTELGD